MNMLFQQNHAEHCRICGGRGAFRDIDTDSYGRHIVVTTPCDLCGGTGRQTLAVFDPVALYGEDAA
jgi:DnaJ-class molecular chaperone